MEENWKDIPGYEGYYQASTLGRVRSINRVTNALSKHRNAIKRHYRGSIKKITLKWNGYQQVTLARDGVHKRLLVHRLIALALISNPYNKPEINHIDGNKGNNIVSNIEWVTSSENQIHANNVLMVQVGENNPNSKFRDSEVRRIIDEYKVIANYKILAKRYNVDPATIRKMVLRKTYRYAEVY